jgi:hypothetical protein
MGTEMNEGAMSETQENTQQQDPGSDLSNTLAAGESEFVATEEKKPVVTQGMLYLLALIAIGGGGTWFMYKRQNPATAAAASVETQQAQQTIDNFLSTGPQGIKMMQEMLHNTEAIVKEFLDYPSVPQIPLSELHTNPFKFNRADGGKVDEDQAAKKKDEEKHAALKASQALNLQSVMVNGSRSACMINNKMCSEGMQIDQFTIEKITREGVVVRTGVYRFELRMQK